MTNNTPYQRKNCPRSLTNLFCRLTSPSSGPIVKIQVVALAVSLVANCSVAYCAQPVAVAKNPYEILSEAKSNAAANAKNGAAQTDLAIYTYLYEDRDKALELYKKALNVSPKDWRASVGLLQAEAFSHSLMVKDRMKGAPEQERKVLAQVVKTETLVKRLPSGKERELALLVLSRTLFEMRQYSRAKAVAELMQPCPAQREAVLKAVLILPSVDIKVALPLFGKFLADNQKSVADSKAAFDEDLWYLILKRLLPRTRNCLTVYYKQVSAALDKDKANESLCLSYGLVLGGEGLARESAKYLELAYKNHPDDLPIALAYARRLWLDGEKMRAEDLVKELLRVNKNSEYDSRHITASFLAERVLALLQQQKAKTGDGGGEGDGNRDFNKYGLLVKRARLSGWHCDCSGSGLRQVLLQNKAVRYAHLEMAEGGLATLLVEKSSSAADPALTSETLFRPISKQVKVTPLPDGKPLNDFMSLIDSILSTEEAYYLPLPGLYRFAPPAPHKSL